jgi:hypothetical protein
MSAASPPASPEKKKKEGPPVFNINDLGESPSSSMIVELEYPSNGHLLIAESRKGRNGYQDQPRHTRPELVCSSRVTIQPRHCVVVLSYMTAKLDDDDLNALYVLTLPFSPSRLTMVCHFAGK